MAYLLDTNICIYLIKHRPASVIQRFKSLNVGEIHISVITVYEMIYGAEKSQHPQAARQALTQFLKPLNILPFTAEDARESGEIRARLAKIGQLIGPYDLQIAGQAKQRNLILVTNNLREFKRIENLQLENWA